MRLTSLGCFLPILSGCAPSFSTTYDLHCANARAQRQTEPASIALVEGPAVAPCDVLGLIEVVGASGSIFSTDPTREGVSEEMRRRAGALGAQAVVEVRFGG